MRPVLLLLCLLPAGCTAVLDFDQCNQASDCLALTADGGTPYCTADHICVAALPDDQLCTVDLASVSLPDTVTIAGLFRLTGANEQKDTALAAAASLAVSEINSNGHRSLRLLLCDTNGDPAQARRAVARAVNGFGAVAFVGPTSSSELVGLVNGGDNLVTKYNVLVVSGSATSPSISSLADGATSMQPGLVWRTCANDNLQAKVLATLVPTTTTTVTDAYVDTTYGNGLGSAFSAAVTTAIPSLVPTGKAFPEGTAGSIVATYLGATSPGVSLIVADSDAPSWLGALEATGLEDTHFLFTDGAKSQTLFSQSPSASLLSRVQGTGPYHSDGTVYTTFQGAYKGANEGADPGDTAFTANTYDAVYTIAIALGALKPGSAVTGQFLAVGMSRLSHGQSYQITDVANAYEALASENQIDVQGASGPIDFDPVTGDVLTAPIEVWAPNAAGTGFKTVSTSTP